MRLFRARVPPHKVFIDRETLRKLYVDENLSTLEIAKKLSISRVTLLRLLKQERLSRRIDNLVDIHLKPNDD
jgi:DNA-binding transcriptional regulator LsrR (DeoR family)